MLFISYRVWVTFATVLTFNIWKKNGDKPELVKDE
jgi:tryptophan-rich sensory protein